MPLISDRGVKRKEKEKNKGVIKQRFKLGFLVHTCIS
jgi:hypothetical protein